MHCLVQHNPTFSRRVSTSTGNILSLFVYQSGFGPAPISVPTTEHRNMKDHSLLKRTYTSSRVLSVVGLVILASSLSAHDPSCSNPACTHQDCVLRHRGTNCCAKCGCQSRCNQVCRLICEDKKVQEVCWGVQTEEFCIPGPSTPGCEHSEKVCEPGPDPKDPCTASHKFVWTSWIPSMTAKIFTKKKLMKKTVTKTVPNYKWVVEDLCPECERTILRSLRHRTRKYHPSQQTSRVGIHPSSLQSNLLREAKCTRQHQRELDENHRGTAIPELDSDTYCPSFGF